MLSLSSLDQTAGASGISALADSGLTAITSQANEIAIAGLAAKDDGIDFYNQTNGFTEVSQITSADKNTTVFEEKILSVTSQQQVQATISASKEWAGVIATFKANNPPSATTPSSIDQYTDGSGYVNFQTTISDIDLDNTKLKIEYSDDGGINWYNPYLSLTVPSSGTINLNNADIYQIGTSDAIDTSGGNINLTITWDTKNALNENGSLDNTDQSDIQIRVVPNDGKTDGVTQTSSNFQIDNLRSILSFNNDVEVGPVTSDIISASWGNATIKKWDYNSNTTCSLNIGNYAYSNTNNMNQNDETNNGLYICLYGEDSLGNKSVQSSANPININIPPPSAYAILEIEDKEEGKEEIDDLIYELYKISPIDLLELIAEELNITVEELIELNKDQVFYLTDEEWIFKYKKLIEDKINSNKDKEGEIKDEIEDEIEKIKDGIENGIIPDKTLKIKYIVQEGDYLRLIADKLGINSSELIELNKDRYPTLVTNPNLINIGWDLVYRTIEFDSEIGKRIYIVQPGDNFSTIALKLKISPEDLFQLNIGKYPSLQNCPNIIGIGWEFRY